MSPKENHPILNTTFRIKGNKQEYNVSLKSTVELLKILY